MTLDELKAELDTFSPVKVEFVSKVVESLSNPPRSTIRTTGTWLTQASDWIQDARTPRDRRRETRDLFSSYQEAVSSIVMLRAFRDKADGVPRLYQLVEIPVGIFDSIQQAPLKDFERDAPVIDCLVGNKVVARVAIDRSDAKITVRGIQLSACTVHAEWQRL